jgi:hypothetical protein
VVSFNVGAMVALSVMGNGIVANNVFPSAKQVMLPFCE